MADENSTTDQNIDLESEEEDTQAGKYLTFIIANEDYGIEMRNVTEIIGIQKITIVPDMPDFVKGVINLRGKVIPVMDVRLRFQIEARAYDDRTCIIVVDVDGTAVGLVVDRVSEVLDIPDGQIEHPPHLGGEGGTRFMKGLGKVEKSVKIILDVQRLLYDEELDQIREAIPTEAAG